MPSIPTYLIGAVVLVAAFSLAATRWPLFQKDLRRSISIGVALLGLLTIILSVHVLTTGYRLREAALVSAQDGLVSQWNGLILGAILLLMVSSLAFFFAIGVFIWSIIPPPTVPVRTRTLPRHAFAPLEPAHQILNPAESR